MTVTTTDHPRACIRVEDRRAGEVPPGRVVGLDGARARLGPLADRVAALYHVGDPSWRSDDASAIDPPAWLDVARCERAGLTLRRFGILTVIVLRDFALPMSYQAPAGVEPLIRSGKLVEHAGPRLYRTAEYVIGAMQPGAMRPGAAHWKTAARIRGIHQRAREGMLAAGWKVEDGSPLPQPDLAATALLFGPVTIEGLRRLGAPITEAEADDVAHFARVLAHGQGVLPELQADTHAEGLALFDALTALNGPTNDDGRTLMQALLDIPYTLSESWAERLVAPILRSLHSSVAAHLLGDRAHDFGITAPTWAGAALRPLARSLISHRALAPIHDMAIASVLRRGRARRGQASASATGGVGELRRAA